MSLKAKVILSTGDAYIVEKTVAAAKAAITTGLVELDVLKKVYNTDLTTINIGEKIEPSYSYVATKIVVNAASVIAVVEAEPAEALVYTGAAELADDENSEDNKDPETP